MSIFSYSVHARFLYFVIVISQRLLKSLPNWLKLLKAKEGSKMINQSMDESPEDVRNQNLRESDLLTGLFYGKTVQRHEIITDTKQMNQLAHLQESLVRKEK